MKAIDMTVEQFKAELKQLNQNTIKFHKQNWSGNHVKSTKVAGKRRNGAWRMIK